MKRFLDWLFVRGPAYEHWNPLSGLPPVRRVIGCSGPPCYWPIYEEPLKFPEIDESLLPTKEEA